MTTKADLSPERLRALLGRLQDSRPSAAAGLSTWLAHVEATRRSAKGSGIPAATPRRQGPLTLTIGMATHDDFDGAYFTVQAIRLFHPEVAEQTEILVVDNDPRGIAAEPLKRLESHIPGYRYVPFERWKATAVKDVVFREAAGTFVLCIDSHVLLAPGSLRKLLDYIDAHPDTNDLLQGPARHDNLRELMSHMEPVWRDAMFGTWAHDQRADDVDGEPFEIPMQGTGLFCCRRAAWPGFNARFVGFGGEEGYLHEKFRRRGDRTLCLPFLRWLHRFERPRGATYRNAMEDSSPQLRHRILRARARSPAGSLAFFRAAGRGRWTAARRGPRRRSQFVPFLRCHLPGQPGARDRTPEGDGAPVRSARDRLARTDGLRRSRHRRTPRSGACFHTGR